MTPVQTTMIHIRRSSRSIVVSTFIMRTNTITIFRYEFVISSIAPPGQMENGAVASMTRSEHDQRHGLDVDAEARQTVAEPVQNHRADADERADFREMKRLERSQVILRAQEQHGGECEEAGISPVARLASGAVANEYSSSRTLSIGGRGQVERQPFVRGAAGHGDGAG